MKIIKNTVLTVSTIAIVWAIGGCGGAPAGDKRQARLLSEENTRLKSQMQTMESELAARASELEKLTAENTRLKTQSKQSTQLLIKKMMDDYHEKVEAVRKENERLQKELDKYRSVAEPNQ